MVPTSAASYALESWQKHFQLESIINISTYQNMFIRFSLILAACLGILISAGAQTIVGTGSSSSFVVIEAADFGAPLLYEYRYNYNPSITLDTYIVLSAIALADPGLSIGFINYGDEASPNYIVDSITFNSVTLTTPPYPLPGDVWFQAVSGGLSGYPTGTPISDGIWIGGSGISAPYRIVQPGSWDGFVFGEYGDYPTIAPVPEPSALLLLIGGVAFVVIISWRKQHA